MPRVLTKAGELMANADMLRRELDAERAISKLLAEALETVLTDFNIRPVHARWALRKYDEGI